MIEREARSPKERKLVAAVIYNRLHEGMPLGIDATIRFATGNYDRAADRIRAGDRLALQHPHQRRPAAGPDRQPGPRLDRGRRPPGQGRLPLLRGQAGSLRRARLLHDRSRIRADVAATTRRAKRPAATRRTAAGEHDGMPRLAVLGHPVGHSRSPAMQNAALAELGLAEEWSYEAIDVAPDALRGAGARRCPARASPAPTSPSRTRARRWRSPTTLSEAGARDRRRQHAQLRATARSAPTTPTPAGLLAALPEPAGGQAGAGARRRRRRPRGRLGAAARGRRGRGLEPHRGCAPSDLCAELGGTPVDGAATRPTTS